MKYKLDITIEIKIDIAKVILAGAVFISTLLL